MSSVFALVLALLTISGGVNAGDINSCAQQRTCLEYSEGPCAAGSRTVCLGINPTAAGCILGATDNLNNMCTLVGVFGTATNLIRNDVGPTCGTFAGGSVARFGASDAASPVLGQNLFGAKITVINNPDPSVRDIRVNCVVQSSQKCNPQTFVRSTVWTVPVTECPTACSCDSWSVFAPCEFSCNRRRRCVAPNSCLIQDIEHCETGNPCLCKCTNNAWTPWSTCVSNSQSRSRSCTSISHPSGNLCGDERQTQACVSCDCTVNSWSAWGQCVNNWQKRTRSCGDGCPDEEESRFCDVSCGCICYAWGPWSSCSASCGSGTQIRWRNCEPTTPGVCCPNESQSRPCWRRTRRNRSGNQCRPRRRMSQRSESCGGKPRGTVCEDR